MTATFQKIPLDSIRPNPDQPRRTFRQKDTDDLARSILAAGKLHQPVTVRPVEPEGNIAFELVMGERRWRAHRRLVEWGHRKFASIACHVEQMTTDQCEIASIVENLQRVDVNPIEESFAFQRLVERGYDNAKIAELVGVDEFRVRERLDLIRLDPQIQHLVRTGQLAPTCGVELSKLDMAKQREVLRKIHGGKISTISEIRAAVTVVQERDAQGDFLGDAGVPTKEEKATLNAMEKKIDQIKSMICAGFKDGECVIARKVTDPGITQKRRNHQ